MFKGLNPAATGAKKKEANEAAASCGSLVGRTLTDDPKFNGLNPVATGTKRKEIEGMIARCGSIFCRTIDSWFIVQG